MHTSLISTASPQLCSELTGDLSHHPTVPKPLRIGIILESTGSIKSLAHILDELQSHGGLEVAAVIPTISKSEATERRESLLFRYWRLLGTGGFGKQPGSKDLAEKLKLNPSTLIESKPSRNNSCSRSTIENLYGANLDLIIQIGGSKLNAEVASVASHGACWVPDLYSVTADATWFWTMYGKEPVFEVIIETLDRNGGQSNLHRSFAATDYLSLSRNRATKLRKISEMILSRISRVHDRSHPEQKITNDSCPKQEVPLPGNAEVARFMFRSIAEAVPRVIRPRLFKEHWFIAYRKNPGVVPNSAEGMTNFQIVTPPKDRFYADPFLIRRDGKDFLFFEDYPFDFGKGMISFVEFDERGNYSQPRVALEREYHLSYPFIFEHDETIYMVPESLEARRVDLYRAAEFPRVWTFEKTLLEDVPAVDPTIFFLDGKFWLFVSGISSAKCINEELHLFYSSALYGKWMPHPKNPIVSDVRRARPAGHLFLHEGRLIRPAQDCSPRYGRAVCFNHIEELSETEYRERSIATIGPEWHPWNRGTHTFNQTENLQVIDGRVLIPGYQHNFRVPAKRPVKLWPKAERRDHHTAAVTACSSVE